MAESLSIMVDNGRTSEELRCVFWRSWYRSRSRSYSPVRNNRYDDRRDRRGDRRSPAPSGLLVRNISLKSRHILERM
nr:serine/arginine-rich SC35-like splicing factor SCL28 [Ipomoea batatas]